MKSLYCMISIVMNHWDEYAEVTRSLKQQIASAADPLRSPHPPIFDRATGFILVVDWNGERILGGKQLPKPLGFLVRRGLLYVVTWGGEDIVVIQGNEIVHRIEHPWFNHLHSIEETNRGLLVTSSGTDLIAEIDEQGQLLWEYFMFEHGYDREPYRLARTFTRSQSYNHIYIPSNLKAHVNSALLLDDDTVLATLFGPGELVRIDRKIGSIEVVLGGLSRPHAIRRRPGGYLLSDTEGGVVVLLDRDLRLEGTVPVPAPWIQDSALVDDRLLVVANRRVMVDPGPVDLATDGRARSSVMELTMNGTLSKRLDLGSEHRLYMVQPISEADALAFADAWADNGIDARWARWETAHTVDSATEETQDGHVHGA
jgi:hypothetical protein